MGWGKVIILSVIAAIYTAAVAVIPALEDTSLHDTAVNLEAWILFAMLIIMNCETRKEATIKTFIFFLISQPLIYLIEVLVGHNDFSVFQYYRHWFIITLLTIPGAAIAFQVKKKGWLGTLALSVAVGFLGYMAVIYYRSLRLYFPNHLLSMIFCIALAVMMIILFIDKPKLRLFAAAVLVVSITSAMILTKPVLSMEISLPEGEWTYEIKDENIIQLEQSDSDSFTIHAENAGGTIITFTNEDGKIKEYYASVSASGIYLDEF